MTEHTYVLENGRELHVPFATETLLARQAARAARVPDTEAMHPQRMQALKQLAAKKLSSMS